MPLESAATSSNPRTECNNFTCPAAGEITIRQPQGSNAKTSTLYLAKIASAVGKGPGDYLQTTKAQGRLIAKNVPENGKNWDYYLMHCPNGPPCDFLEDLEICDPAPPGFKLGTAVAF